MGALVARAGRVAPPRRVRVPLLVAAAIPRGARWRGGGGGVCGLHVGAAPLERGRAHPLRPSFPPLLPRQVARRCGGAGALLPGVPPPRPVAHRRGAGGWHARGGAPSVCGARCVLASRVRRRRARGDAPPLPPRRLAAHLLAPWRCAGRGKHRPGATGDDAAVLRLLAPRRRAGAAAPSHALADRLSAAAPTRCGDEARPRGHAAAAARHRRRHVTEARRRLQP
mmetsp:Transcript_41429/g.137274  ORF Transcript_41429/g.137274 Transcript_41429/m.137274 type:complete len:225 (-) Transcript_41429:1388-2062(-)